VFAGSTPVGGLLMGWIASQFGVAVSLAAGGIACLVIGAVGLAWLRSAGGRAALAAELGMDEQAASAAVNAAVNAPRVIAPGAVDAEPRITDEPAPDRTTSDADRASAVPPVA
jgi:hypothetical protein